MFTNHTSNMVKHVEEIEIKEETEDDLKPSTEGEVLMPQETSFGLIRNKVVRNQFYNKYKKEQQKIKRDIKKKREIGGEKKTPHTIESLRVKDETTVGDLNDEDNEIIRADLEQDEFSKYYENSYVPKVLITYAENPVSRTRTFGKELQRIIPNSRRLLRNHLGIKQLVKEGIKKEFTDILIINENRRQPNGLLVIHLPNGPTAHFKLSSLKLTTDMNKDYKRISLYRPEVILNNFSTRLGLGIGRMLGALFHYNPEFVGRRAVAFHNQRDYIFFRHYLYEFDKDGKRSKLFETGPRFTLKLRSLQKGTFDSKYGQYEWIIEGRRHDLESNRRRFHL
ncbi:PREDICTED: probable ribosome production factor 1 [Nicrophorus vespilloides]|uniref:Probable ribosome production factor 1 n=1 Tax=Nicrophorus vespilloides TaxID=110193 RepID=A0ABM1MSN0_NICVS|nr:PREDICTED: probable ribosome production factor 1 [Nicrophorus vespilloides]